MTSSVAGSLNNDLATARGYPIFPLIEYIRATLMGWFSSWHAAAKATVSTLTPKIEEILAKNFELFTEFALRKINDDEFEIRNKEGVPFLVNLESNTCNCQEFQMLHIPCPHAVVVVICTETRVDSLVAIEHTTAFWNKSYECSIYPVTAPAPTVAVGDDFSSLHLMPPSTRRPPGRDLARDVSNPVGEFGGGGPRRFTVCGRCGGLGHNRATCKMPI